MYEDEVAPGISTNSLPSLLDNQIYVKEPDPLALGDEPTMFAGSLAVQKEEVAGAVIVLLLIVYVEEIVMVTMLLSKVHAPLVTTRR